MELAGVVSDSTSVDSDVGLTETVVWLTASPVDVSPAVVVSPPGRTFGVVNPDVDDASAEVVPDAVEVLRDRVLRLRVCRDLWLRVVYA